jgi:hypothetical protein
LLTDAGDVAGTLTVSVMVELPPPLMPGAAVQVTMFKLLPQDHRFPLEV